MRRWASSEIKPLYFPTVLGGVVPAYNLPGVNTQLQFTGEVLADIFLGKSTSGTTKDRSVKQRREIA